MATVTESQRHTGLHCPNCHNTILANSSTCPFCGHFMRDDVAPDVDRRNWQEVAYCIAAWLMVAQGLVLTCIGFGLAGLPYIEYMTIPGLITIVMGVGLIMEEQWAQWIARVVGILALIAYVRIAIELAPGATQVPGGHLGFAACIAGIVYWVAVEYLLWTIGE